MKNILLSSVYVGTYAKYNAGSIAGKWINLADFTTKRKFYDACKDLHKDEKEPEFMFQDYENIPEYMVTESWVSDEIWHVINSLKKFASDKVEDFATWCEDNGAEQDYEALREFLGFNKKDDKKGRKDSKSKKEIEPEMSKDEMKARILEACKGDERLAEYVAKDASAAAVVDGKLVIFYKQKIETRFCFDDENEAEMKIYRNFTEDYFIDENMRQANTLMALDWFEGKRTNYYGRIPCLVKEYNNRDIWKVTTATNTDIVEQAYCEYHRLSDAGMDKVHGLLKVEKTKFEAKLRNYLKRYGLTKIHTWSYWANA